MKIFARHNLTAGHLERGEAAVLLEGTWPLDQMAEERRSVEVPLQADAGALIREARRLTDSLFPSPRAIGPGIISMEAVAYLDAPVIQQRLARFLAAIRMLSRPAGQQATGPWQLYVERDRDQGYELLIRELAEAQAARLMVVELCTSHTGVKTLRPPSAVRRHLLGLLSAGRATRQRGGGAPIVLCGGPTALDPLCAELLRRDCRVLWISDRFQLKEWLRWRAVGVEALFCHAGAERHIEVSGAWPPAAVTYQGIALSASLSWFVGQLARRHARRHAALMESITDHLSRLQPIHVVVDHDAAPCQRAALAVANAHRIGTTILQDATTMSLATAQTEPARVADAIVGSPAARAMKSPAR